MMKLNWGNFARHRESWLAMMMMISMMMMMMMAAINSVIHSSSPVRLVDWLLPPSPPAPQSGLGLNPILVPLSHSSVWDFNSNFFSPVFGRNESECKFFNVAFWFV